MTRPTLITTALFLFVFCVLKAQNPYTAILFDSKKTYVVRDNELLEGAKKNTLNPILDFGQKANTSLIKGNELWIGTNKGVRIYDLTNLSLLRTEFADIPIAGLTQDAEGKIWVATTYKGLYKQNDANGFDAKMNAMTNYCVLSTPDKNVYLGTNIGLYQIPISDEAKTVRYAEEAHSGHGLPDNLVENLYADASSNLWVMMPDNVSFKKYDNSFGEIPTFSFVGNKENQIYKVLGLTGENYLFVTSNGILLLPSGSLKHHGHGDEVFSEHDTNAVMLDNTAISKPENLSGEPILYAEKNAAKIYFYTLKGIWSVKEKKLFKFLKKQAAKK
ncbi:hypothetical protein [Flavobacterium silvaticum]|uniref:Uncharacterized protein n=1 Tax=Flavobacterium silvaticum TaxID=1852020 RepID=A0A972FME9_9FLAO|nr:hypothetical protein [Flavobacterium silvaticum]NMH27895.1 hypothetical protein [Flavobacterium silvaticum]